MLAYGLIAAVGIGASYRWAVRWSGQVAGAWWRVSLRAGTFGVRWADFNFGPEPSGWSITRLVDGDDRRRLFDFTLDVPFDWTGAPVKPAGRRDGRLEARLQWPAGALLVGGATLVGLARRAARRSPGACRACGYDLSPTPTLPACPECGAKREARGSI